MLFDPDFSAARAPDGSEVQFTRSEARALAALVASNGRTLTRNQLLDAVSEEGSEKNDRNVDFLINRLRKKLGDSARDPKFIATRYGEGYVWLGAGEMAQATVDAADISIGVVRGLDRLEGWQVASEHLRNAFAESILAEPGRDLTVRLASDAADREPSSDLTLEMTFFDNRERIECVVSARLEQTNNICFVERLQLGTVPPGRDALRRGAQRIAPVVLAKAWGSRTSAHGQAMPLPVAMHEASERDEEHELTWRENDVRLRTLRADAPDDPSIKLMYATHLHTKYVTLGFELFRTGDDTCPEDEAEIEKLVLEALDFAQTRPEHAVVAAKLLYFVDGGYRDLAEDMTDRALDASTDIASTLAMAGQLKGFLGDTDTAVAHQKLALSLSEKGSTFYLYTLVMLCQSLMSANRLEELATYRAELYAAAGLRSVFFEPMFADPQTPALRAKAMTLMLSRSRAQGILRNLFYVSGRLFASEEQRENSMRTPINLFVRRFGPGILTDEMRASMPGMLARL